MTDPDPAVLARDLRLAMRPLWRRFTAERTLSHGKLGILGTLNRNGATAAARLAESERISPQAVATAIRELEELGLVQRQPDPDDRRRALVSLTPAGRERYATERDAAQPWLVAAIDQRLTAAERATLASAVELIERIGAEEDA